MEGCALRLKQVRRADSNYHTLLQPKNKQQNLTQSTQLQKQITYNQIFIESDFPWTEINGGT